MRYEEETEEQRKYKELEMNLTKIVNKDKGEEEDERLKKE